MQIQRWRPGGPSLFLTLLICRVGSLSLWGTSRSTWGLWSGPEWRRQVRDLSSCRDLWSRFALVAGKTWNEEVLHKWTLFLCKIMQYFFEDMRNISIAELCIFLCICTCICNFLAWNGEGLMVLNFFNDGVQLSLFEMMVQNCPLCYDGVKLSAESNCPLLYWWCQIVLFCMMVSNCLQCQILSAFNKCS